jgi:ParB family chromosome partitioning protein
LRRSTQIARWIELTTAKQETISAQVEPKIDRGRPEGGINAASRDLGIDRNEAQRAVKIAGIEDDAVQAVIDAGGYRSRQQCNGHERY